jgi:hypothetical protein
LKSHLLNIFFLCPSYEFSFLPDLLAGMGCSIYPITFSLCCSFCQKNIDLK